MPRYRSSDRYADDFPAIPHCLPIDPDAIAASVGAQVRVGVLPRGVSAARSGDEITVSRRVTASTRQRELVGHESGHIALDHQDATARFMAAGRAAMEADEAEADAWGARAAVPDWAIGEALLNHWTPEQCAIEFNVAEEIIGRRFQQYHAELPVRLGRSAEGGLVAGDRLDGSTPGGGVGRRVN